MTKEIGTNDLQDTWASAGTLATPDNTKKSAGWQSGERPAFQFMNWIFNTIMKQINYLMRNGIPAWNAATSYLTNDVVKYNGVLYIASANNLNSIPPGAGWALIGSKNKLDGTAPPTVTDDGTQGYSIGSRWFDLTNDEAYVLLDTTTGAALWVNTTFDLEELSSLVAILANSTNTFTGANLNQFVNGSAPTFTQKRTDSYTAGAQIARWASQTTSGAVAAALDVYHDILSPISAKLNISVNRAGSVLTQGYITDGFAIGNPTGAGKGIGTINVENGIYLNNKNLNRLYASSWVNFNGVGTVAIRDSENVSSITDNGVGHYRANFTVSMANLNYCVNATGYLGTESNQSYIACEGVSAQNYATNRTLTYITINCLSSAATQDGHSISVSTLGGK